MITTAMPDAAAPWDSFTRPDGRHSPAAYWFWHKLPSRSQIRSQVAEMRDGGYLSFLIQARLSYPVRDYLSEQFLAACRAAVDEAARAEMTVGIYDEYGWQSGQAGGRTVRGADHLRERHVFWSTTRPAVGGSARAVIDGIRSSAEGLGPAGLAWQYDGGRVAWRDWQVVAAVAYPSQDAGSDPALRDVTADARVVRAADSGCTVEVREGPHLAGCAVTVFVSAVSATSHVPSYLLPETARRLIDVGYEPFRAALGGYFGTTVRYLFFDQPHPTFHDWPQRHGNLRSSLPFSAELAAQAEAVTRRGIGHVLLALVNDIGPHTASVRCDFYQAYTDLVCRHYLGTIADWCHEHGLALSGHEVLGHVGSWHPGGAFTSWDLRVNFGLDYFGVDTYRDITGVDAQNCIPQLSAKMGDSVARSSGRSGCIVEQYLTGPGHGGHPAAAFAGQWGLSLQDLRAQAIRQHLAGARQFLFHAFWQTDGYSGDTSVLTNPRFDFPPGINFEPWWPFHRAFAEETGRLSAFLDGARPACDVAVFYPLRTCWAEGPRRAYGDHIEFWSEFLTENGIGFHFIDERDVLRASASAGRLKLAEREYPCVILPSVTCLGSLATMAALRRFAEGGGLLVSSGDTPAHVQHGDAAALRGDWARLLADCPTARQFPSIPSAGDAWRALAPLLGSHPHATLAAGRGPGHLWQWAGHDGQAWRLALFNDSIRPTEVRITLPFPRADSQDWDACTGLIGPWETGPWETGPCRDGGGRPGVALEIRMAPMELRASRFRAALGGHRAHATGPGEPAGWEMPLRDGWTLNIAGRTAGPVPIRVDRGWEQQGFAGYSGAGIYSCSFDRPGRARFLRLRLPGIATAVEARLNGTGIGSRAWQPFDFPLPVRLLRASGNQLELTVYSAAGNKYYSGTPYQDSPEPSGLTAPPVLAVWPRGIDRDRDRPG